MPCKVTVEDASAHHICSARHVTTSVIWEINTDKRTTGRVFHEREALLGGNVGTRYGANEGLPVSY